MMLPEEMRDPLWIVPKVSPSATIYTSRKAAQSKNRSPRGGCDSLRGVPELKNPTFEMERATMHAPSVPDPARAL